MKLDFRSIGWVTMMIACMGACWRCMLGGESVATWLGVNPMAKCGNMVGWGVKVWQLGWGGHRMAECGKIRVAKKTNV